MPKVLQALNLTGDWAAYGSVAITLLFVVGCIIATRLINTMGRRPMVRGSVMNPVDHPHGGGEGKSPVGRPGPVTPWGKPTLGYKTRKKKNPTDKYIVKRRNAK